MMLSSTAKKILQNPTRYLGCAHTSKSPIKPEVIHERMEIYEFKVKEFAKALTEIRKLASKKGVDTEKELVWESIRSYVKVIAPDLRSLYHCTNHLRGLYGCVLPKKMRTFVRELIESAPNNTPRPFPTHASESNVGFVLEGVEFTLTQGSMLSIGEIKTKKVDFKGLKSISVDKVANGSLYGVRLEA